ncbi:hypothetical protein DPMN_020236 [Dreissena polymorpha]|uniref:Proliferating cell nuclear antigen PCNA N-terminal domain-containing protein n=1 Tax=Dreissena polymorpha TaxID=45954 RepID=A0A9D4NK07_DREPO|nr:hypothetical protein DPMN_020236 [Dreissena polymorpha]
MCFTIDKDGIHLKSLTTINLMIEVDLHASNFDEYRFEFDEPLHVGIESYISKSFKIMKNKNIVTLSITKPGELIIGVKSKHKEAFSYDLLVITEIVQNVSSPPLYTYSDDSATAISTSLFSDMCKLIKSNAFCHEFTVTKEHGTAKFSYITPDLVTERFTFGQEDVLNSMLVHNCYKSDQLFRITKIVSFSQDSSRIVNVYIEKDKPLLITSKSELGIIKTYFL